jgi:hypothetical protein
MIPAAPDLETVLVHAHRFDYSVPNRKKTHSLEDASRFRCKISQYSRGFSFAKVSRDTDVSNPPRSANESQV